MNPVWIVDDDRSIRWVFEKALAREHIAYRTFASAQEALGSHRDAASRGERHPHAGRVRPRPLQRRGRSHPTCR
jgi:hypothetical protein